MRTQKLRWGIAILLFTVFLRTTGFAQDVPSNLVHTNMVHNQDMSDQALENWRDSFQSLKSQINMLKQEQGQTLPADQAAAIDMVIARIDEKLATLSKIDVYTINEIVPGEAFPAIRDFYNAQMTLEEVDSTILKQQLQQQSGGQEIPSAMIQQMFSIPQTSTDQLIELIEQNKFQAASGASGKSRISIMTVYINPLNYQVMEGTTVVIATDK